MQAQRDPPSLILMSNSKWAQPHWPTLVHEDLNCMHHMHPSHTDGVIWTAGDNITLLSPYQKHYFYSPLLTLFPPHHLSNPIPFQPSTSPHTHRNSKLSMEIITITPIARQPSIYFPSTNLSPSFSLPKTLFSSTSSSHPYRKNLIAKRGPSIAMALQSSSASPALGQYLPFCHSPSIDT